MRQDVIQAADRLPTKAGVRREIDKLGALISESERVEYLAGGLCDGSQGLLALTTSRVIFLKHGRLRQECEDFAISSLSGVNWASGLLMGKITLFMSGRVFLVQNVDKGAGEALALRLRELIGDSQEPTSASAAFRPEPTREAAASVSGLDVQPGIGWWKAKDGNWYRPELHPSYQQTSTSVHEPTTQPAAPTTPVVAASSPGRGWWIASDGAWYPPARHPNYQPPKSAALAPSRLEIQCDLKRGNEQVDLIASQAPTVDLTDGPQAVPTSDEPSRHSLKRIAGAGVAGLLAISFVVVAFGGDGEPEPASATISAADLIGEEPDELAFAESEPIVANSQPTSSSTSVGFELNLSEDRLDNVPTTMPSAIIAPTTTIAPPTTVAAKDPFDIWISDHRITLDSYIEHATYYTLNIGAFLGVPSETTADDLVMIDRFCGELVSESETNSFAPFALFDLPDSPDVALNEHIGDALGSAMGLLANCTFLVLDGDVRALEDMVLPLRAQPRAVNAIEERLAELGG